MTSTQLTAVAAFVVFGSHHAAFVYVATLGGVWLAYGTAARPLLDAAADWLCRAHARHRPWFGCPKPPPQRGCPRSGPVLPEPALFPEPYDVCEIADASGWSPVELDARAGAPVYALVGGVERMSPHEFSRRYQLGLARTVRHLGTLVDPDAAEAGDAVAYAVGADTRARQAA